jgi:hypothetical protein
MNVIVVNQQESALASLNIEIIKTMRGVFTTDEIIGTFTNFFFVRMIIDVTALQNYEDAVTYQKLSIGLPIDKVILLIPPTSQLTNSMFLSKLISMGYYNFTTNIDGVRYLLATPNSYRDVAHLHQLDSQMPQQVVVSDKDGKKEAVSSGIRTLGVKNVTEGAGASSLIYMMKKELEDKYGMTCLGIEVDKKDFMYFRDKNMISCDGNGIATELLKAKNFNYVLVDLNNYPDSVCDDVIYLVEPSVLKLNKLMMRDRKVFERLRDKKVIINRSVLSQADVREFAREAGINIFYMVPAINDREESQYINELLIKLGMVKGKK